MDKKDNRIGIRLSTEDKEQLVEQAEQRGLTVTDYILKLVGEDFFKKNS